jgi:hypothetical protein
MLRRRRHNTPYTVAVTPTTATVTGTATQQFTAAVANVFGAALTRAGVWSTSKAYKATVSVGGLATGVANNILTGQTATGGTTSTVVDAGQTHVVNAYAGKTLVVTAGTNNGASRTIVSNDATTFVVTPVFSSATDATTVFSITNGGAMTTNINFTTNQHGNADITPAVLTCNP